MGPGVTRESDFRWDEFVGLPIADQIRKCQAMATEAKDLAALADRDIGDVYMVLARQWSALATEIETSEPISA